VASLWKHPQSPFWSACFTVHVPQSQQWKRSLRTRDRKLAWQIADTLDEAGRGVLSERDITAFVERIGDGKVRGAVAQIFRDVFRSVSGRQFGAGSLRAFAESWVSGLQTHLSPRSYPKYKRAVQVFLAFLGEIADRDLIGFGPRDDVYIIQFRDALAERLAAGSVNLTLKIIRQMFKTASQRFKIESPAHFVPGVRTDTAQTTKRRAFTLPELGRILRAVQGSEWEGIILAGLYTGQRVSDIALLRWENVDLDRRELALTTRKTGRRVSLPVADPLADYLLGLPATDEAKDFIFPKAAATIRRSKSELTGALSNQFHDILVTAGLVRRRSHYKTKDGRGRSSRRRASEVSFHSLRHTITSLLKNAGVSQSVVMDLVGHESKAISQIYTHVGEAEKRQAMAAMPAVGALLRSAKIGSLKRKIKNRKR
jgi:integrase